MSGKGPSDVLGIQAVETYSLNMIFFPVNLNTYFPKLKLINLSAPVDSSATILRIENRHLSPFPNLEVLSFRYHKLRAIDSNLFAGLNKLKFVTFYANNIEHVHGDDFIIPSTVTTIDFSFNKCVHLKAATYPDIANLKIHLHDNCFSTEFALRDLLARSDDCSSMEYAFKDLLERTDAVERSQSAIIERTDAVERRTDTVERSQSAIVDRTDAVERRTDTIEQSQSAIVERTDAVERNQSAINDSVKDLTRNIEGVIGDFESVIDQVEQSNSVIRDNLEGLTRNIDVVTGDVERLTDKVFNHANQITTVNGQVEVIVQKTDVLEQRQSELSDYVRSVTDNFDGITNEIVSLAMGVEANTNSLRNVDGQLESVKQSQSEMSDEMDGILGEMERVSGDVKSNTKSVTTVVGQVQTLQSRTSSLEMRVAYLESLIEYRFGIKLDEALKMKIKSIFS